MSFFIIRSTKSLLLLNLGDSVMYVICYVSVSVNVFCHLLLVFYLSLPLKCELFV